MEEILKKEKNESGSRRCGLQEKQLLSLNQPFCDTYCPFQGPMHSLLLVSCLRMRQSVLAHTV